MSGLGVAQGWLGSPPGADFDIDAEASNPFLRYRRLLWAYRHFTEAGRNEADYAATVTKLDRRVAEIDGGGFRVTPTQAASQLGERLGLNLWVKDETCNVTGTHKARHLMGLALHLDATGEPPGRRLAISSCGNAALAAATVAAAAGRPLDVFIPPWADETVVVVLRSLGAHVEVCHRRPGEMGDPCFGRFRQALAAGSLPFCAVAAENIWTIDGGRTLAFEMVEALGGADDLDALFVQVGGGALASSVWQGFTEASDAGVIGRPPKLYPVQTEGCAPLRRAWERLSARAAEMGIDAAFAEAAETPDGFMAPWDPPDGEGPQSIATGILDDVTYDWMPILWGVAATGGDVVVAPESLVAEAHSLARQHTDVAVDPTGTAGLAGLLAARRAGLIEDGARVGVLFTGVERGT